MCGQTDVENQPKPHSKFPSPCPTLNLLPAGRLHAAAIHSGGRSLLQTPGGPTPADPSSPAVVAAASWVVNAVNAPGSPVTVPSLSGALVLLSIPAATQQVVNGMLYQLMLNCTDSAQHRIMLYVSEEGKTVVRALGVRGRACRTRCQLP